MAHVFTVGELTQALRDVVEGNFPLVWVKGEVSGLARPTSGHVYFSLKDAEAVLSVVWFRRTREAQAAGGVHPLTGEVCEAGPVLLRDGASVLVAGRLTVYPPRGGYQLVAELVEEQGAGALALAFEALKRELAGLGYFDESRKMAVPRDPRRVAVITSPRGAAVRDFLRLAAEAGAGAELRIHPVLVQGAQAPAQIAAALDAASAEGWAEAVCLVRGGGSLEDLWAFNTREVADAVFRATIPVVSGVGHEIDVTIADLVADRRAATPSHAAQGLWTPRRILAQRLDETEAALLAAGGEFLTRREGRFAELRRALLWLSPARALERLAERHASACGRLTRAGEALLARRGEALDGLAQRLERAMGPGVLGARAEAGAARLEALRRDLERAAQGHLERNEVRLERLQARLAAIDPEAPLARGYGLVRVRRSGVFLRGPDEVRPGDLLDIRVQRGEVAAVVAPGGESAPRDGNAARGRSKA